MEAADPMCQPPFVPTSMEDMSWLSPNFIYFMLFFYVWSEVSRRVLPKLVPIYKTHSWRTRRNMDTYLMEVFVTTVVFIMAAGWGLQIAFKHVNTTNLLVTRASIVLLASLYIWEIAYRIKINWQLLAHHLLTILLTILAVQATMETADTRIIGAGILLTFSANTEQLTFIGLFLFRAKSKYAPMVLKIAAIQSFMFKIVAIVATYIVAIHDIFKNKHNGVPHKGWYVGLIPIIFTLIPLLLLTQIYGTWILWKISKKAARQLQNQHQQSNLPAGSATEMRAASPVSDGSDDSVDAPDSPSSTRSDSPYHTPTPGHTPFHTPFHTSHEKPITVRSPLMQSSSASSYPHPPSVTYPAYPYSSPHTHSSPYLSPSHAHTAPLPSYSVPSSPPPPYPSDAVLNTPPFPTARRYSQPSAPLPPSLSSALPPPLSSSLPSSRSHKSRIFGSLLHRRGSVPHTPQPVGVSAN